MHCLSMAIARFLQKNGVRMGLRCGRRPSCTAGGTSAYIDFVKKTIDTNRNHLTWSVYGTADSPLCSCNASE